MMPWRPLAWWDRLRTWRPLITTRESNRRLQRLRHDLADEYGKRLTVRSRKLDALYDSLSTLETNRGIDGHISITMRFDERMLSGEISAGREFAAEEFARYIQHHFERLIVVGRRP